MIELVLKIASLITTILGGGKIIYHFLVDDRTKKKELFKFTKDFIEELKSNNSLHPFLREKGYQIISGTSKLKADEVEFLITLENPDRALKDYLLGKKYIELIFEETGLKVAFKQKYKSKFNKNILLIVYFSLYAIFAILSLSPILFEDDLEKIRINLLPYLFAFLYFGFLAIFFLMAGSKIGRAISLVKNQKTNIKNVHSGQ